MNTTTSKRQFIRGAYKAVGKMTSHKYYDNDWRGVKDVVANIIDSDKNATLYQESARYEGVMGQEGHRKVYDYTITGCDKPITMQIIACFCGTMADPMSAYDITLLLN